MAPAMPESEYARNRAVSGPYYEGNALKQLLAFLTIPREWEEENQLWIQHVSSTPATRLDVANLQEQLDHMLQKRQARETGICPVRRELYSQCFGESFAVQSSLRAVEGIRHAKEMETKLTEV
jgi:hypothetical protein